MTFSGYTVCNSICFNFMFAINYDEIISSCGEIPLNYALYCFQITVVCINSKFLVDCE